MRIARLVAVALAVVVAVLSGGPAWAHNSLTGASPGKNATVRKSPGQVKLSFLQNVDPKALTIVVTDAGEQEVPAAAAEANGKVGTLRLTEPLDNGVYTVTYRVVSLDGHPVKGSYKFTVDGPAPSPEPSTAPVQPSSAAPATTVTSPAPPPLAAEPASATADGPGWWPIAVGIAVMAALIAGGFLLARRRGPKVTD
jgi:methionine-rich copper-binding protein CopC